MEPRAATPPLSPGPARESAGSWLQAGILGATSAGFILWAALDPRFRDAEGLLTGRFAFPLSAASAAAVWAVAAVRGAAIAGFWLATAILGGAASLQTIEAGKVVRYQHYVPFQGANVWFLGLVALQAVAVAAGLRPFAARLVRHLRERFGTASLLALAAVASLFSAALSRRPEILLGELALATVIQAVHLGNAALVVLSLPASLRSRLGFGIERLLDGARFRNTPRLVIAGALWVGTLAATLAFFSYQRHPHVPDEVIYLFQARYFAEGKLWLPPPPSEAAFDVDLLYYAEDRWYSPVAPAWPATLALGVWIGAPWIVNAILGALNVLLAWHLLSALYERRTAQLAVALLCLSPWHVFMSMNLMTHNAVLVAALGGGVAAARALRSGAAGWAVVAGLGAAFVSLVRPLEGLITGGLLGLWLLAGKRPPSLRLPFAFAASAAGFGSVQLFYNRLMTGSPTKFPIMYYIDKYWGPGKNDMGFGPDRGGGWTGLDPFPGHGAIDVVINAALNLFQINVELLGWGSGSLLVVSAIVFSRRLSRSDVLMLVACLAVAGAHSFYWFSGGPDFGARYWYLCLVPCLALAARSLEWLGEGEPRRRQAVLLGAAVLSLVSLVDFFPWRAIDKYFHYRGMRPDVRELAREHDFGRSLVLVRGRRHPDYASAFAYNPLDLEADAPVYARDGGPAVRRELAGIYPDRPVWVLEGPTRTGRGFEIVTGPVPMQSLLDPPSGLLIPQER